MSATLMPITHSTGTWLIAANASGKVVADSQDRLTGSPVPSPAPGWLVILKADDKDIGTLYVADTTVGMSDMMGNGGMMGSSAMMGDRSWRGWTGGCPLARPGSSGPAATFASSAVGGD